MRVLLLGPLEAERDSAPIVVAGGRLRALLAALALEAGGPVSADRLVEELWGAEPPAAAGHALQSLVSRLRGALGDRAAVSSGPAGYRLEAEVDAAAFLAEVAAAERAVRMGDHAAADAGLTVALERWRGPALADLGAFAFAARAADRLEAARQDAELARGAARLALGDPAGAASGLAAGATARPHDERLALLRMRALAAAGRPAEALATYEALRVALDEQLGTPPSAAARALHGELLTDPDALALPHLPATPALARAAPAPGTAGRAAAFGGGGSDRTTLGDGARSSDGLAPSDGTAADGGATADGGSAASGGPTADGGSAASGGPTADGGSAASGGPTADGGPTPAVGAAADGGVTADDGPASIGAAAPGGPPAHTPTASDDGAGASGGAGAPGGPAAHDGLTAGNGAAAGDAASPVAWRAGSLPAAVTPLVGRAAEVEQALGLLADARLVTLVGPGGAGKTRLALEVARRRAADRPGGAWLVELAPLADPAALAETILAALGQRDARLPDRRVASFHREALARLEEALAGQELLLVLDNCEHLVGPAAELAATLLARLPDLQLLATSREPLAVAGEHLLDVGPLGLPAAGATPAEALTHPAVALFAARAAQVSPGFRVDEATVSATVEVCRRLDGLPLALELAAARLRSLGIAHLATRLDDRFRLLTGGSRTALPRQRTLRAVVDWSFDLLEEPDRRLARRVAVLNAGITPEDAAAVAAGDGVDTHDVPDGLAGLAERSLLQLAGEDPDGAPRYRMLETLREYGLERMAEAGELERVRTAHAHHVLALAAAAEPESRGPGQVAAFRRLAARREDVLAALRRLHAEPDAPRALRLVNQLLWFWLFSGGSEEARDALALALATPGEGDPTDRLVAQSVLDLLGLQGRADVDVQDRAGAGLDRLAPADLGGRPLAQLLLPLLAWLSDRGDDELAVVSERVAADPDPWLAAAVALLHAQVHENRGELTAARARHAGPIATLDALGDRWLSAVALSSDAQLAMSEGHLAQADASFARAQASLEVFERGGEMMRLGIMRADVRLRRGDPAGARALLEADLARLPPGSEHAAMVRSSLAGVAWSEGDPVRAAQVLAASRRFVAEQGAVNAMDGHVVALVEGMAALIALQAGDRVAAAAALAVAHRAATGTRDAPMIAWCAVATAWLVADAGDPEEAARLLGAAERLRGAADATAPPVARLHERLAASLGPDGLALAMAAGRDEGFDAASARVARASDPAAVGAQGERDEDREQHAHAHQRVPQR